jgi:6-phosphofructokinase 2
MQIVTLTMNPALDKSTSTLTVVPEDKLRCAPLTNEPGGGGLNVSRTIHKLGGESLAVYAAGGLTGEMLRMLLDAEGLLQQTIETAAWTRENFTVLEESSTHQFRFTMPGPICTMDEWQACLDALDALDPKPEYVVASGSLPPGVPVDFYLRVAERVRRWSGKLIVDTSGAPLREMLQPDSGVFLIKPNLRELGDIAGYELRDDLEQVRLVKDLITRSCCESIVVSLGGAGVLYVTPEGNGRMRSPTVPIRSKIGAGDSMVAGIVLSLARGKSMLEAIRFGVATGAATVMTPGTELCRREDVERLDAQMERNLSAYVMPLS